MKKVGNVTKLADIKITVQKCIAVFLAVLMLVFIIPWSSFFKPLTVNASNDEKTYTLKPDSNVTVNAGSVMKMGGNSDTSDYFTLTATAKDIIIEPNSKKVNDISFAQRIKMQSAGSNVNQNISFTTSRAYAKVTVYALSGTGTDSTRPWVLENSTSTIVDKYCINGSALQAYTYYISGADTYYMYSAKSGINVYGIVVEESDSSLVLKTPDVTAVASGNDSVVSWCKVAGATAYEVYSSADNYTSPVSRIEVTDLLQNDYQTIVDETVNGDYTYAVRACTDNFMNSDSAYSNMITIDLSSNGNKKLNSSQWNSAKLGTQSDKMTTPSYNELTNTLTLKTSSAGKMANTGQSGLSMYYTKIKSTDYNFTIKGRFNVKKLDKQDNQSSFGLMVLDSLGTNDTTADYLNQIDICAATKNEATGTCIPGIRTYIGNSDATGKSNASGTCDVTQYFDKNAEVFTSVNATNLYYNFEMVKDSNGYVCNWYNDDWSEKLGSTAVYNPGKLLQQDTDYVYVGFYASRVGDVEVSDISYEQHTPTENEIAAIDKGKWLDYDHANIKTFNGDTTSSSDYTYRFNSNVTGTVTITDSNNHIYYTDKEITDGSTLSFKLSDFGYELAQGTTTFTTIVTPYQNSADADGVKEYQNRLLLKDYSPITVADTVTRSTIGETNATLYVSPDGTTTGDGSKQNPYDINTAVSYASAGQSIILMDGTYHLTSVVTIPSSVSGTAQAPITIKAETTGKAILDGSGIAKSSDSVLFIKGSYWNVYGLNICNSSDGTKGIHVAGNHNTVEMCELYRNGSTGLQISYSGGEPKIWWPTENIIKNCTSYYNCDSKQNDADGFAAKLSVGSGNVFDGCISHNNADDGFDLYAKDKAGYGPIEAVIIKNCLAYSNGVLENGSYSAASGNGFKLGGEGLTGKHQVINCVSWNNGGSGVMSNNGPDCQVYNTTSVDNGLFSRVGGTDARNNYQLTPKNGTNYLGTTGYVMQNAISFYSDKITDFGTTSADKIILIGQKESAIYTENNYLCTDISKKSAANTSGDKVSADWFETVDYEKVVPTRNEDGSIDMHGLFVLTKNAPMQVGAVINENRTYTVKFTNQDSTVLQTSEIKYETIPEYTGPLPVKASDSKYSYSFAGWDKEIQKVTGDVTYVATFKATELQNETEAPTQIPTQETTVEPTKGTTEATTEISTETTDDNGNTKLESADAALNTIVTTVNGTGSESSDTTTVTTGDRTKTVPYIILIVVIGVSGAAITYKKTKSKKNI